MPGFEVALSIVPRYNYLGNMYYPRSFGPDVTDNIMRFAVGYPRERFSDIALVVPPNTTLCAVQSVQRNIVSCCVWLWERTQWVNNEIGDENFEISLIALVFLT